MRAVANASAGRSKAAASKTPDKAKKPKKAVANDAAKRSRLPVKRLKKPNEKFKKKKLDVVKRSPKRGEEGGPPTLCEAYTRLTTMVAETVITEKTGLKPPDATAGKSKKKQKKTTKPPAKKKPPASRVKLAKAKAKKPTRQKKSEKASLDKSENLVSSLKDDEATMTHGKGIGARRKSVCHVDDADHVTKAKAKTPSGKQVTKPKKAASPPKPVKAKVVAKKVIRDVRKAKTSVKEKKPKKLSQPKTEKAKKKVQLKVKSPSKAKAAPKIKKPIKKVVSSETEGSNSDEITLNVLMKKQAKKAKRENTQNTILKIKKEVKTEEPAPETSTKSVPRKPPKKAIKAEKDDYGPSGKESATDSEEDVELQRLLAKKFPKSKQPTPKKPTKTPSTDTDQRSRRMRLYGFWSGPKRHRVASLNAIAKVHCLYENEAGKQTEPESKQEEKKKCKKQLEFEQMESVVINKRTLRGAPRTRGGIGKHWEMGDSTTSSMSSDESPSDADEKLPLQPSYRQKLQQREDGQRTIKQPPKRRRHAELGATMDLKDMVVRKRMASLNASAILAASYSMEKRTTRKGSSATSTDDGASSPDDTRSEGFEESKPAKPGADPKSSEDNGETKNFWKTKVENLKKGNEKRNSPSPILAEFGLETKFVEKIKEKELRDEIHEVPRGSAKKTYRRRESPVEKTKRHRSDDVKKINLEKIRPPDEYEYKSDSDNGQRKMIELRNAGSGSNKKVAVIVNQDTDVTITGVYVNSTRSTHHEGYCSISGMQYRISSTSHTQTEATAVINPSSADQPTTAVATDSTASRPPSPHVHQSYTPLSALSSMQPPPAHGHSHPHGHVHHHCGLGPPQGPVSPLGRRQGCSSAFSAPPCNNHPAEGTPTPPQREDHPIPSSRRNHGGYYQPAGPLIQHPSSKAQAQDCSTHEVSAPARPADEVPDNLPPPITYGRTFPPYQGPYYSSGYYPPPPPQPAHYQPPQATSFHQHYHHHQDLCYPPGYPPGSYPPPPTPYRRYLAPPPGYHHPSDLSYSSSQPQNSSGSDSTVQQMVVPGGSGNYPPSVEHYPPPPPSSYCSAYPPGPGPSCYPHPASGPSRNLPFLDSTYQSCPCPIQACPKNVHTGPLTGECKRPGALPLPPVALALPQEPPGAAGPPSPARGSAGGGSLALPASTWTNTSPSLPAGQQEQPAGLLAISETATPTVRKRKDRREGLLAWKKLKPSNENVGVDRKPSRKTDPAILKDKNTDSPPETIEQELKWSNVEPAAVPSGNDTVSEVIEDVVRGRVSKSNSPPVLEPELLVKPRRGQKNSLPPPTLKPAIELNISPPNKACVKGKSKNSSRLSKVSKVSLTLKENSRQSLDEPVASVMQTSTLAVTKKRRKSLGTIPRPARLSGTPRWSNGWAWDGSPFDAKVYLTNDESPVLRRCYPAMRHTRAGDTIKPRDCILLKAGPRKTDLPFVAKVSALWENPEDGEMMVSLLWYYRPEHTDQGRQPSDQLDEIFASRHKDFNSVACIEDKCFVLTFNEYCRYRKKVRGTELGITECSSVVPKLEQYPWQYRQPPGVVSQDIVFFCQKIYDFRQKRLLKTQSP